MPKKTLKAQRTKGRNVRNAKFLKREIDWLLWALVYIGNRAMIMDEFERRFEKTISKQKIDDVQNEPEHQPKLEDIRTTHDKELHMEYLASKRSRLKEYTELYERAKHDGKWRDAAGILKNVDEMFAPKSMGGDINLLALQQNNHYVEMPLEEIEKKKLELLDKYSHVMMKLNEEKKGETITIKGTEDGKST